MLRQLLDRPVLASAILVLIILGGFLGISTLPLNQYPEITPPLVSVGASLPGASADVAKQAVATVLEQELNGTPRMQYMESSCTNTGGTSVTIVFEADADPDIAAVDVQNRVKLAEPRLPLEVVENGISVEKQAASLLMLLAVHSDRPEYDYTYLSNFSTISILDFLKRVPGVGRVSNMASRYYSMRVWLNPTRMAGLGVTVNDVRNAIREQNSDATVGTLGTQPVKGVSVVLPLVGGGRLTTEREFEDVIIRATTDGALVKLRDIARVELGSSDYNKTSLFDGQEATILSVYLLPNANSVATARAIRGVLQENSARFPEGIEYTIIYDYGRAIENWLYAVGKGIVVAAVVALLVLGCLLRNLRALLVIASVLPVIFIGAFALFGFLGLTINMLSLLAVALSVGFALDDLILVVHRTREIMGQSQLSPKEAALRAVEQQAPTMVVTAALLAVTLGIVGFMGGVPGRLYREFVYALAACVVVSTVLSVTIAPVFCAALLRPKDAKGKAGPLGSGLALWERIGSSPVKVSVVGLALWLVLTGGAYRLFSKLPTAFLPEEDQGYIFGEVILPDGAAFERTSEVMDRAEASIRGHPAVKHIVTVKGISARVGTIDSRGHFLIVLKPWAERSSPESSADAIMQTFRKKLAKMPEAVTFLFNPPTIPGLGSGSGFVLKLQDRTGQNWEGLVALTQRLLERCSESPVIGEASTNMQAAIPQFSFEVDEEKALVMGVSLKEIYSTCAALLASANVNDFNLLNRTYRVKIQADQSARRLPRDLRRFHVRSRSGQMVPISTFVTLKFTSGPGAKRRYNMFDAVTVMGLPASGYTSGQSIAEVQRILSEILPEGFDYQWSGITYEEIEARKRVGPILFLSVTVIVVLLAARYENWLAPLAAMSIAPIAMCGAAFTMWITGLANGLYFQISLLAVIGLALKQASVTVAEVQTSYRKGGRASAAALHVLKRRAEPALLAALAFAPGLIPFVLAGGAGAETRRTFTTGVLGGVVVAAVMGLILVPLFCSLVFGAQARLFGWRQKAPHRTADELEAST